MAGSKQEAKPAPSGEGHRSAPRAEAKSKRTGSGWKWLFLGIGGASILLLVACGLAYLWGYIKFPDATTVDSEDRESIYLSTYCRDTGTVGFTISYPSTIQSGETTYIGIDISNNSDMSWDGISATLDSSRVSAGDSYFSGFALDVSSPLPTDAWNNIDGVLGRVEWNRTPVPAHEIASVRIGLRAIKPGAYGTDIIVVLVGRTSDTNCAESHAIYSAIRQ